MKKLLRNETEWYNTLPEKYPCVACYGTTWQEFVYESDFCEKWSDYAATNVGQLEYALNENFVLRAEKKALLDYFRAAEPYILALRQLVYTRRADIRRLANERIDKQNLAGNVQTTRMELEKLGIHAE